MSNETKHISLPTIKKRRIVVNKDKKAILELDTSDITVITRFKQSEEKLNPVLDKLDTIDENAKEDANAVVFMANVLSEVDTKIREIIDWIFDANVSEVCLPVGRMYDVVNGKFMFEYIIEALIPLYSSDIQDSLNNMESKVSEHTSKYVDKA